MISWEILRSFFITNGDIKFLQEENPPEPPRLGILFAKKNQKPLPADILGVTTLRHTESHYPKTYWESLPEDILGVITRRHTPWNGSRRWKVMARRVIGGEEVARCESDKIKKSGVKELVQILSENEVTSEDKRECDMLVCENSPICDDHYEIFSNSKNDDDISSDDDAFKDIEYVEASLPNLEIVSLEEENDDHQEEEEFDLEEIQDVALHEKLLSINRLIANIKSLNDNPTPIVCSKFKTFSDQTKKTRSGSTTTHADNSFPEYDSFCFEIEPDQEMLINVVKNNISDDSTNDALLEEVDLFIALDNSIPQGIENFGDDSEGDIHFLEELIIDDSIPFPVNEASDFDNPSFPRPPSEPQMMSLILSLILDKRFQL
nr:hypothetical protein [Tanacetum cinerariifolium]